MKIKAYIIRLLSGETRFISALLFGAAQFIMPLAHAQTPGINITINNPQDINKYILCPIAATMFYILIGICSIMVLYAAFIYMTSGGESEKVDKARRTITYAAVAVTVALLAKAFPTVVASIIGGTAGGC